MKLCTTNMKFNTETFILIFLKSIISFSAGCNWWSRCRCHHRNVSKCQFIKRSEACGKHGAHRGMPVLEITFSTSHMTCVVINGINSHS